MISSEENPNVQSLIGPKESDQYEVTIKNNDEWQEAASRRGVENLNLAIVDPWSVGTHHVR